MYFCVHVYVCMWGILSVWSMAGLRLLHIPTWEIITACLVDMPCCERVCVSPAICWDVQHQQFEQSMGSTHTNKYTPVWGMSCHVGYSVMCVYGISSSYTQTPILVIITSFLNSFLRSSVELIFKDISLNEKSKNSFQWNFTLHLLNLCSPADRFYIFASLEWTCCAMTKGLFILH